MGWLWGIFFEDGIVCLRKFSYFCEEILETMDDLKEQRAASPATGKHGSVRRENLGKFFYDLAKLVFAGLVVGAVTPLFNEGADFGNPRLWGILAVGVGLTVLLGYVGNKICR